MRSIYAPVKQGQTIDRAKIAVAALRFGQRTAKELRQDLRNEGWSEYEIADILLLVKTVR